MRRRRVVRLLALAAAGLAGCTSSDEERGPPPTRPAPATPTPSEPTPRPTVPTPTPDPFVDELRTDIAAVELTEGEDGRVAAAVPVENTVDQSLNADLAVTIEADAEYTASQRISVAASSSETFTVTFDVDWESVTDDGEPRLREVLLYEPGTVT